MKFQRGLIGRFLDENVEFSFSSSNIASASYDSVNKVLIIGFSGGGRYAYYNVTRHEATGFAHAPSKGKWFWTYIRVRGSKTAHKKRWKKL